MPKPNMAVGTGKAGHEHTKGTGRLWTHRGARFLRVNGVPRSLVPTKVKRRGAATSRHLKNKYKGLLYVRSETLPL